MRALAAVGGAIVVAGLTGIVAFGAKPRSTGSSA